MRRFSLSAFGLLVLFGALPASNAIVIVPPDDRRQHLDGIRALLDQGEWKEAAAAITRAETQILDRSKPRRDDDRDLAELALYLAVVEANGGQRDAAEWYWYMALTLNEPTAYRDVQGWGRAAEVFGSMEKRSLGRDPRGTKTFRIYPGKDFDEPKIPATRLPKSLESSHAVAQVRSFQVEVFLDEQGIPHSPRLLGPLRVPMLYYSLLKQLFEKRWKPARSEGKAVPLLVTADLTPDHGRW